MPTSLITKSNAVAGTVPSTSDLAVGELAVNLVDRKLFTKDSTNAVVEIVGSSDANLKDYGAVGDGVTADRDWETVFYQLN